MHINTNQSRRAFMRHAARVSAAGAAAPMLSSLGLISEAAAADASDYKAIVCVFLYGGNDYANTLTPYDANNYEAYRRSRPQLALSRNQLTPTALRQANDLGGRQYALNPALAPLLPIFNAGSLAPILNIGALVEPTSKAAYERGSVRLPSNLFSHNDQQSFVQSSEPEGALAGWGGRMGDLLKGGNGSSALTCVSVDGNAVFLSGESTTPYAITPSGSTELLWNNESVYGSQIAYDALLSMITAPGKNWLADEYTRVTRRALDTSATVQSALRRAPQSSFKMFSLKDNPLAEQLQMVARLASQGPSLGLKRQVFFVGMGGWDTHSGLLKTHPGLLGNLASALSSFNQATQRFGLSNKITTFTASDFGRTLRENGDGTDHGWGSVQFVMGGAVKGGRIYGRPPITGVNTSDDVDAGRLIPTTSIDQLAATLAQWFGLSSSYLPEIIPNLRFFDRDSWNLGVV